MRGKAETSFICTICSELAGVVKLQLGNTKGGSQENHLSFLMCSLQIEFMATWSKSCGADQHMSAHSGSGESKRSGRETEQKQD